MSSTMIHVRDAATSDAEVIARFNQAMATETEDRGLEWQIVLSGVRALLADPARGRYFVAVADGEVAGQIMITTEWSDWRNAWFWWLQSVYVHQDYRRLGVFRAIYQHIEALARSRPDVAAIRLYVETENQHAQQTYESLGFHFAHYHVFEKALRTPSETTPP